MENGASMEQWLPWVALPTAAIAVVVVIVRGLLRQDYFTSAAKRDVGITAIDLLLGMCCFLMSQGLSVEIISSLGWDAHLSSDHLASAILINQLTMGMLVMGLLYFRLHGRDGSWRDFGFNVGSGTQALRLTARALVFGVVVVLAINYACVWVGTLLGYPKPPDGHELLKLIRETTEQMTRYKFVLSAVVAAPIVEEVVYRGLMQTALLDVVGPARRWTAIFIAATLFASVHIGAAQWQTLPGLWVFGIVLGWLYEKTGSLLPSILTHMAFNASMIGLMFLTST